MTADEVALHSSRRSWLRSHTDQAGMRLGVRPSTGERSQFHRMCSAPDTLGSGSKRPSVRSDVCSHVRSQWTIGARRASAGVKALRFAPARSSTSAALAHGYARRAHCLRVSSYDSVDYRQS